MSLNGTSLRTTPKTARNQGNPMYLGIPAQRFFAEGEEQEATRYENAQLPPDDAQLTDPEAEFESFDKVPKQRRLIVTVAALGVCLAVGTTMWATGSGAFRTGASLRTSASRATTATTATTGGNPTTATSVLAMSNPALTAIPDRAPLGPLVVPMPPNSPTTPPTIAAPGPGGPRATAVVAATEVSMRETTPRTESDGPARGESARTLAASLKGPAPADRQAPLGRSPPLRGYVWSPAAKALVPAEGSSLPTTDPDLVGGDRGQTAVPPEAIGEHHKNVSASEASSDRDRSAPTDLGGSRTRVAPAEPNINRGGGVAPAEIGAAPDERPVPTSDSIEPPPFAKPAAKL